MCVSFLGGGCWQHYVPAVVDEIVNRAEFVTAYCGGTYSDLGKFQARFEFYSMMGEMLGVEAVSEPIYDWATAAGFSLRMAARVTGRNEVLIPAQMSPDRLAVIKTQCQPEEMANSVHVIPVAYDEKTGRMDMDDLRSKLSEKTAGVYFDLRRSAVTGRTHVLRRRTVRLHCHEGRREIRWRMSAGILYIS